jgi:tetratricopeptide (TPR) repeat protein
MMPRPYLPMAPAPFTTGLVLALFLVPGLAVAGPSLSGSYQAEPFGRMELTTQGSHVIGTAVEGGACRFDASRKVLEGDFEGSVLVARLTLCLTGELCPQEQSYSVLGFYNEEDGSLVAHVRLREGCYSVGLPRSGRFVLTPVKKELPEEEVPTSGTEGAEGAASGSRNPRMEAAREANLRGDQLYKSKKFFEAARQFKQSQEHDPGDTNWPAYLGRGSSLLKMGETELAIKDLERARLANASQAPGAKDLNILYMLGCAYGQKGEKRKALEYLRSAVEAGYPLHKAAEADPDLKRALGSDPQFKDLVTKSLAQQNRGTAGSGSPGP